ncbi:MAG: sensor histidine kinase [bacterium]
MRLTETLMWGCIDPIISYNVFSLDEYAENLIKKPDIAYVIIMDRNDHVLTRKPDNLNLEDDILLQVTKKAKNNKDPYLIETYYNSALNITINDISVPLLIDSKKWGTVRIGFSLFYMRKEIVKNILVVMMTGLISVIIGIIVALILRRFITGPIEKFKQSMKIVSEGNLDEEMTLESSDEFEEMVESFNRMARSLKKKEEELSRTNQRLNQTEKIAFVGRSTLCIAHAIDNYTCIIENSADALVDEKEDPGDKIITASLLKQVANKFHILYKDMKRVYEQKPMILRNIDLNDILEKQIQLQSWEFQSPEDQKIRIITHFNCKLPPLLLNKEQIDEITSNMIINASQAKAKEIIISTDWDSQGNESEARAFVRVEFKDNGEGIPKEIQNEIFNFLFTTKDEDENKGFRGLGLSIVSQYVKNHGGWIEMESEEGKGAKFTIFFPVNKME